MGCVELIRGVRNALPKRKSPKRKPKLPLSKRQRTWRATEPNSQNSNHSSLHPTGFRKADEPNNGMPEWVASTLSSIAKHMLESSTIDREAVAQSLLGLMVPAPPPAPPDAQQNGVSNNIIDMCDVASRGNNHEGCADLATKHEQSETYNENDDRRNPATRGYQDPQTERNVRLLIASINVTSAVSGSGAAKERTYETGGLNMTGRMAELDYLFSDADLDIIGVQESRLPTNVYTVFNSGPMPGKHHYGVQLWVKKHHAKAVEMHRSCQSKTAYC